MNYNFGKTEQQQYETPAANLKKNIKITTNLGGSTKTPPQPPLSSVLQDVSAESIQFNQIMDQEEEEEHSPPVVLHEVKPKKKRRAEREEEGGGHGGGRFYYTYMYFLVLFCGSIAVSYYLYVEQQHQNKTTTTTIYPLIDNEAITNKPILFNFSMYTPFYASAHLQVLEYNFKQYLQKGSQLVCMCMHHLKTEYHTSYQICAVQSLGQIHLMINPRLMGKTNTTLFVEWDEGVDETVFVRLDGKYATCVERVLEELK